MLNGLLLLKISNLSKILFLRNKKSIRRFLSLTREISATYWLSSELCFYKCTALSLCSDALTVTLPGFAYEECLTPPRSARLSADPPYCSPSRVPRRLRECRSGTMVLSRNSGNSRRSIHPSFSRERFEPPPTSFFTENACF